MFVAVSLCVSIPAAAFENERVSFPDHGTSVSSRFDFYIEASGGAEVGELYQIEVARDSDFEDIVAVIDMKESRKGWMIGDSLGVSDIAEEFLPQDFEGIHYRSRRVLKDGEYYWRAYKSVNGGDWSEISGEGHFFVDTRPPRAVDTLRIGKQPSGAVVFSWEPIARDEEDNPERVAGYRIYSYPRVLMRYPVMTRYLTAEVRDAEYVAPIDIGEKPPRITYFRVRAVDDVGNEDGRRSPKRIGELDIVFNPPDLDQLTNPQYLRQLNDQYSEQ